MSFPAPSATVTGSALVAVSESSRSPRSALIREMPVVGQVAWPGRLSEQPGPAVSVVVGVASATMMDPADGVTVTALTSDGPAT